MPHLLFIDDDLAYSPLVQEFLETQGYEVDWFPHSDSGLSAFQQGSYDLCLLDVRMPHKDGFVIAEEIRKIDQKIPLIFLTGVSDKAGKLQGFNLGADDYITKPFSLELLHARIKAVMRRFQHQEVKEPVKQLDFKLGLYDFDSSTRKLVHEIQTVTLTAKEAGILSLFAREENQLVKREKILQTVWGEIDFYKGMSLNVYISKLRKYLVHDPNIQILNIHGEGYKLTLRR